MVGMGVSEDHVRDLGRLEARLFEAIGELACRRHEIGPTAAIDDDQRSACLDQGDVHLRGKGIRRRHPSGEQAGDQSTVGLRQHIRQRQAHAAVADDGHLGVADLEGMWR